MTSESVFTIIFIIVVLAIPFSLGLELWRVISKRKEIENQFSEMNYVSGRVIGYTERRYDSENTKHHYAIVEYFSDQNEVIWAETGSCNKGDYSINAEVDLMYHPLDNRYVKGVVNQDMLKVQLNFEKNLGLVINIIFTILLLVSVIYYEFGSHIILSLLCSYIVGFVFGAITKNKSRLEEKLRIQDSEARNKRLRSAQEKEEIPCYLQE